MSATKIKALAIADYLGRDNVNPIRPEAAQLIYLQRSGRVDVTVMCSPESILVDYYRDNGIQVITHKIRRKISPESIRFIRRQVREQGFQILHLFHSRAISNGILAAIGLPVKVVVYRGQPGSLRRYDPISYLNGLNPRVDKIICVSRSVEDYLHKQIWGKTDKPVTIYKGHDLAWYQNDPADLSDLDLPADAFKVAMVANLRPHKGLHVLVAATHRLPPDAPIYFLLMGAKTKDREIQDMVNSAARPERFRLLGYRNDAPEVAAACDIVVLPTTKREGLARAVVEAMAYGRPAVVSDTGGNAELVADGESGIVVPVNDPVALANGIAELWSDPEKRRRYGEDARRRIRDIFNVEQGAEKTLQVYLELAGSSAA
jgi:glycosyltransferase involved in cell wall biosynthesis